MKNTMIAMPAIAVLLTYAFLLAVVLGLIR